MDKSIKRLPVSTKFSYSLIISGRNALFLFASSRPGFYFLLDQKVNKKSKKSEACTQATAHPITSDFWPPHIGNLLKLTIIFLLQMMFFFIVSYFVYKLVAQ